MHIYTTLDAPHDALQQWGADVSYVSREATFIVSA